MATYVVNYTGTDKDIINIAKLMLNIEQARQIFDDDGLYINKPPEYVESKTSYVKPVICTTGQILFSKLSKNISQTTLEYIIRDLHRKHSIEPSKAQATVVDPFCIIEGTPCAHRLERTFTIYGNGLFNWNIDQNYISGHVTILLQKGLRVHKKQWKIYNDITVPLGIMIRDTYFDIPDYSSTDRAPLWLRLTMRLPLTYESLVPVFKDPESHGTSPCTRCNCKKIYGSYYRIVMRSDKMIYCTKCYLNYNQHIDSETVPTIVFTGEAHPISKLLNESDYSPHNKKILTNIFTKRICDFDNIKSYKKLENCVQYALKHDNVLIVHLKR